MSSTTVAPQRTTPTYLVKPAVLNVVLLREHDRHIAKCPELDLVTEMDTRDEALVAMAEIIREYAEDYHRRAPEFLRSLNRAHHKPYVDQVLGCATEEELLELVTVRYGNVHLQAAP